MRAAECSLGWSACSAEPQVEAPKNIQPADAGDSAPAQIFFVVFNTLRFQKFYELVSE
jgi:hypothetical protein